MLRWMESGWPVGRSLGIYNCRPVRGRQSMSIHSEGRAVDYGLPVVGGVAHPVGMQVVRALGERGDELGVQTVIFDRRIWSARSPNGRRYTGVNPHLDHLHIELTREGGRSLTVERLGGAAPARPTLRLGDRGLPVVNVQRLLKVRLDGVFGAETEGAVRRFQAANGLLVDGVVGPRTWALLTV